MGEFWPVADALAYLTGSWRVERSVRDRASGAEGRFTGTTVFSPSSSISPASPLDDRGDRGDGLLHHESGVFTWQGTSRPAERTLWFLPGPRAGTAAVRFSDGRPFHDLDLATGRHVADHPCAADLYRGEFTVFAADRWRTVWRVGGPAKDLLLTTEYTRTP
ncbi:hypothetical protein GFH48_32520 [Streptomyces fagopyri]|uniref:DUF6314 domain-containing protein n=1 Tax=Streptomyces fagopyri TaxID=2662397 RepID=A0A5Q0LJL8_9ACTN|nr:DUF6314 family protein [Streptomyces fagopyri]QFZ77382.1 hypothetical protein GFH48_32520 [Streptomyces fagopyri]